MCLALGVREQSDRAGTLDGDAQLALVLGASAGHAAGQDLATLAGESRKTARIFIIDVRDLIHAETSNLPAGLAATGTAVAIATILRHLLSLLDEWL